MRLKLLITGIIAILIIFALPAFAYAAASPSAVTMYGDVNVFTRSRTTIILMELKSDDVPGWFINLTLNVPVWERDEDDEKEDDDDNHYDSKSENSNVNIRGSFSLGSQAQELSSGAVVGTLNSNGAGNIELSDKGKSTSLGVTFTIIDSGKVTAVVQGQWPLVPSQAASAPIPGISSVGMVPSTSAALPSQSSENTPVTHVLPAYNSAPAVLSNPENQIGQQPSGHFFWYLSRTSAIAAYILLFINVCLGIGLKTKYLDALLKRWRTFDLHQFTALLGGFLIMLHIFSLLGDSYFKFTVSELLIPMSSPYRPYWTALGTIAFYTGAVLTASFYIRRIIGQKTWRVLHFVSFALFFAVLFHGIKAGTDSSIAWVQWLYISTGTAVAFLSLWRFLGYCSSRAVKPEKIRNPSLE